MARIPAFNHQILEPRSAIKFDHNVLIVSTQDRSLILTTEADQTDVLAHVEAAPMDAWENYDAVSIVRAFERFPQGL